MKKLLLFFIVALFFNSCKKSDIQKVADEYYSGNIDSLNTDLKRIEKQQIKKKSDSAKYYNMVEYVGTESPKCNTFRDIYVFKIEFKDTLGLGLRQLANYLLDLNRPYNIDFKNCDYPFYHDIFINKNMHDAKKNEGNWLIMNSPSSGFTYANYNNK